MMQFIRTCAALAVAALALTTAPVAIDAPAAAAEVVSPSADNRLAIQVNQGQLVRVDKPVSSVFVANSEIADVAVKSPLLIYVFGKRPGTTTVYAVDDSDVILASITLQVTHNLTGLGQVIANMMPGRGVGVQTIEGGILLTGAVPTATEADDILRLASRYIGEKEQVVNQLKVTAPNQVNVRVRIAEVNKNLLRSLGINWDAVASIGDFAFGLLTAFPVPILSGLAGATGFGSVQTDNLDLTATIDLLSQEGLVSLLAEPNLTAISGETATFLAGGEFPIPVSQDENTITVEFKPFGVSLSFTPTVLSSNRISMRVKPEVSTLSTQGQVTIGDIVLPGLAVRRAETTVELASGQTFAIAGLVQANNIITANDVPGLSEIPVLGELFKSDRFQRDETELVILATPYIVQPIGNPNAPAVPNDLTTGAEGSQRLAVNALSSGGFTGQAGFVIE